MLELVTLPPAFGLRNVSPFCLKIEMLLTSLQLPFNHREISNPGKAPKGKLPFLNDGDHCIADSELITEYLEQKTGGRVYAGLSHKQKAEGVALARLTEDHLYWIGVASRWLDDDWWPNVVAGFFGFLPAPIRPVAAGLARREVRKTYHLQGLGRHTLEEQRGFAERDLVALENSLPDAGFLFGDSPCIYDFTVASLLAGMLDNQPATWFSELARPHRRLVDYTEQVQAEVGVYCRYR